MLRIPKRPVNWLRTPTAQILAAGLVMVGGAYLIALWMVGIVLMLAGLGLGADALLRDNSVSSRKPLPTHEDVLDRYRRAR